MFWRSPCRRLPFKTDTENLVQKHGLVKDIEVDSNGMVHAPEGPGLGYEIDFDLIEENKVQEL